MSTLLDEEERRRRVDPQDALADVEGAAEQWRNAAAHATTSAALEDVHAVLVTGMGGSGIAADIAAALARPRMAVPIMAHKGYGLPAWAGPRTLVIAVSYSGNTEETLSAVAEALARGAPVLAICSGGQLAELADTHHFPVARVPGGGQPRHSLGWLVVPLLVALGLADDLDEAVAVLAEIAAASGRTVPSEANPAKRLGTLLASEAVPVVYGTDGLAAVAALRCVCQLNENAKLHALLGVVPELCHNAVVGWERALAAPRGVVWLRDAAEQPRDARRADLVAAMLAERAAWQETIRARGRSDLARLASLVAQVDLASVYAAHARGVDPTPVASIDRLKAELGATPRTRKS